MPVSAIAFQSVLVASTITGRVVSVSDGDTITLVADGNRQVRVRLAEIDAPEKSQAYGTRSKKALSALVFGHQVRIDVQATDRYGRTVGRVYVGDVDVNAELVKTGAAWVYRQYLRDRSLLRLEEQARAARAGLWAVPSPVPPWEYRRSKRSSNGRTTKATAPSTTHGNRAVQCGSKRYCREMANCAEARAYLQQCGVRTLDGDGDGVPCEALCRQ